MKTIECYDVDFIDIRGTKRIRSYFANNPESAESKALGRKDVAKIVGIHKTDKSRIPYGDLRIRPFEQFTVEPIVQPHGNYLDYPERAKQIMRHPDRKEYGEFRKKSLQND